MRTFPRICPTISRRLRTDWLAGLAGNNAFISDIVEKLTKYLSDLLGQISELITQIIPGITKVISGVITVVKNSFIGIIMSIYFLLAKSECMFKLILYF